VGCRENRLNVTWSGGAVASERQSPSVSVTDVAGEPVLDVPTQLVIADHLGDLRPTCAALGMPLRERGVVDEGVSPSRGVAPQLPRDRRRAAPDLTGDLTHTMTLNPQQRDLLALYEGQEPAQQGRRQTTDSPR
jgi:hypothetical protein